MFCMEWTNCIILVSTDKLVKKVQYLESNARVYRGVRLNQLHFSC